MWNQVLRFHHIVTLQADTPASFVPGSSATNVEDIKYRFFSVYYDFVKVASYSGVERKAIGSYLGQLLEGIHGA